jgi:hypothetical protein
MFKRIRAALAARKAYYAWERNAEPRFLSQKIETRLGATPEKIWDPERSADKSARAASPATVGAVAGGGIPAAILAGIRVLSPDFLPWDAEADAVLCAVMAAIGARVWTYWQTFASDRSKHSG